MRLYRKGDEGAPVRDIQRRLVALGLGADPDPPGVFGHGTEHAVRAFQAKRGIAVDGIVGPDTWRTLVAAGYRLGDRLLSHRVPMMRGDDVADLQRKLSSLGFDTGKIDGIFGPDTLAALLEFQGNRRLPEDGIAGREVAAELELMTRATAKHGREDVRERQWLRELPYHIAGQRIYIDSFCRDHGEAAATWQAAVTLSRILKDLGGAPLLSRSVDTEPTERVRAVRANRLGADLVVSFALPRDEQPAVFFFSSPHSSSAAGESLATSVATRLDLGVRGRSTPILKNTRAPAIVVATSPMDGQVGGHAAQGLIDLFASARDTD